jgi:hypothetical protein
MNQVGVSDFEAKANGARNTVKIWHEKPPKIGVEKEKFSMPYFDLSYFLVMIDVT